ATGFLTTVFTCNPVIGMAVGASIGACFGLFAAAETIESSYDVNFNRLACTMFFVSVGIITGALGGYFGYYGIEYYDIYDEFSIISGEQSNDAMSVSETELNELFNEDELVIENSESSIGEDTSTDLVAQRFLRNLLNTGPC
uniref:hypothetical protein n=1 Tax=Methanobrevibacter sp. TaxID=66852 RepID=UPI00388E2E00